VFIYKHPDTKPPRKPAALPRAWHAVTIVTNEQCCPAARARADCRYLSKEAPALPLPECDAPRCECKYRHFDDRRRKSRRGAERTGMPGKAVEDERRSSRGRRTTDHGTD
jgi:hypothetical protein